MKKKIMLIEDDLDSQFLIEECLKMENFDVVAATNAQVALDRFEPKPDLIIMDLTLPLMTPTEFMAKIRGELHAQMPVLIVSGRADIAEQSETLGANAYLKKPFDLDIFLNKIKSLIGP